MGRAARGRAVRGALPTSNATSDFRQPGVSGPAQTGGREGRRGQVRSGDQPGRAVRRGFFFAVVTTGIYCRPSCPAVTPKRMNVRFFPSAAAAQAAGFRACRRCRPDAVPGSAEWNVRADLVGRAMRLIGDGVVDREGVGGLARRLGYSPRQVQRQLTAELGAGPVALARARRAHTARVLLQTTVLPVTELAFAAGFASIRQFNDTIREIYAGTPSELRAAAGNGVPPPATPPRPVPEPRPAWNPAPQAAPHPPAFRSGSPTADRTRPPRSSTFSRYGRYRGSRRPAAPAAGAPTAVRCGSPMAAVSPRSTSPPGRAGGVGHRRGWCARRLAVRAAAGWSAGCG
ncbi:hypothetical protein Srufu_016120 [Streptomyces libani subsp. rufus]|nr:hypothetical protein Srufu_016120 [Streptomyces libani subsp. rufus]